MTGNSLTKYTGLDVAMLEEADRRVESISGGKYVDVDPGDTILRFLPAPAGTNPFRVSSMHFIDAIPGLDKVVAFACPRVEKKERCPACEEADRLLATRNPVDKERAYRISGSLRVYANVLNRAFPEKGACILQMGTMIWKQLKAIRKNARTGGDFTDPGPGGFDIIIQREGSGRLDTKYTVLADRQNRPLVETPEEMEHILGHQHDLELEVDTTVPAELMQAWRHLAQASGTGRSTVASAPAGRSAVQDGARAPAPAQPKPAQDDPDDPENW